MLAVLRADGWLRRMAGIGCAYALALQMLFAGVLATQMAVAGPVAAAICIAGSLNLPIAGRWRVRVEIWSTTSPGFRSMRRFNS